MTSGEPLWWPKQREPRQIRRTQGRALRGPQWTTGRVQALFFTLIQMQGPVDMPRQRMEEQLQQPGVKMTGIGGKLTPRNTRRQSEPHFLQVGFGCERKRSHTCGRAASLLQMGKSRLRESVRGPDPQLVLVELGFEPVLWLGKL